MLLKQYYDDKQAIYFMFLLNFSYKKDNDNDNKISSSISN